MKKLKVNIDDIVMAMEAPDMIEETLWLLDTETGEVLNIFRNVMNDVEERNEEEIVDYPDWQKDMAEDAKKVLNDESGRFVEIPKITSHKAYEFMEDFITRIGNERIRNRLFRAIQGRGAFRSFKDTIAEWPEIEKQWYTYHDERAKQEVVNWLNSIGIEHV